MNAADVTKSAPTTVVPSGKPTILHLGDDIRWNHDLYTELSLKFNIIRTHSMGRDDFKSALQEKTWGNFVGMYRPFWNTGGEMGNWDVDLIPLLPKSCKVFASAGAGFDWVDTKLLAQHGVVYCNSASACTESVADAAVFLILAVYRLFSWSVQAAHSCDPEQFRDAMGNIAAVTHNPNGSTLGIVGLGRIGYRIAQKMRAFEMNVMYHDVVRMEEREREVDAGWCDTLEELLGKSDCVLIAAPFAGQVLLGEKEFGWFKRGARLVNVARGKLVDEDVLVTALDDGVLSAAGLDVHADEPYVNKELATRRNVMMLSHTAGASVESHIGFERLGLENLLGWLDRGEAGLVSPVNLQWLRRDA
ncbi:D-mandelate dehydrogenase-like protein [Boeremia exigua]|uniref:D-mandelate dehydrogenase-like protein n=1 Tax=Boeremia exigua TaxID=749465 RepID=UPI001E8CAC19|nr:D-mandelate dehydrogenase-like protein [Boeremia exigua]KAH6639680.1 D-mandelate dehydrogenase-like protein [Boeremia exigua]